ncbi:MAG: FtsX-like permease family protein, partial [Bacteroidetes bacterium]|nr:FtsX-like permease family protein [Bacteroidota bacterium]
TLIWKRAVACQMIHATIDTVAVDLTAGLGDRFRATGSMIAIPGFMSVYQESFDDEKVKGKEENNLLPDMKVGDKITCYFIQQPPRMRRFTISGIFEIEIEEFSKLILVDIGHIQKLNDWEENQISGFEIFIDNYDKLDYLSEKVEELTEFNFDKKSSLLKTSTVKQLYPQSLYWIELFDTNTIVILILMVIVAGFNMISGLFIIILERINMIGILKALGTENWSIRKLFLYHASFLIGKGLFWGNFAGISLCLLQKYFGLVTLDPSTYYISVVPINFSIIHILLINLGTLIITVSMLILPTIIITKISPAKAIRFE